MKLVAWPLWAAAVAAALSILPACRTVDSESAGPVWEPDLEVGASSGQQVDVSWKDRLAQPYVFVEHRGSYAEVGPLLARVAVAMSEQGIEPWGPPFALFYDDPGSVPVPELRARACFPVGRAIEASGPLAFDVLPSGTVVYAFIGGPYPEVPLAYPALHRFAERLGWAAQAPIREVYLVNPGSVETFEELVCEVQIPATSR